MWRDRCKKTGVQCKVKRVRCMQVKQLSIYEYICVKYGHFRGGWKQGREKGERYCRMRVGGKDMGELEGDGGI